MNIRKKLIISASVMLGVIVICVTSLYFLLIQSEGGKNDSPQDSSHTSNGEALYDDPSADVSFDIGDESYCESKEDTGETLESTPISESVSNIEEDITLTVPDGTVINSPNVLVYNLTKQATVYSNITYEICAPASMIKMLTALVALDHIGIEDSVLVGDEIDMVGENSSVAYIVKGSRYKMTTMLEALMLPSGNDAAYCLAVNAARAHADDYSLANDEAVKDFVRLMNEKAKSLGCISSSFQTPDGYDAEGQYTTTEDMLKISIAAYTNPHINEVVKKPYNEKNNWYNSNMLIREDSDYYNPYVTGLKTGSTSEAGMCLAVSAEIGTDTYIMLFMKGESSVGRFLDANVFIDLIKQKNHVVDETSYDI